MIDRLVHLNRACLQSQEEGFGSGHGPFRSRSVLEPSGPLLPLSWRSNREKQGRSRGIPIAPGKYRVEMRLPEALSNGSWCDFDKHAKIKYLRGEFPCRLS